MSIANEVYEVVRHQRAQLLNVVHRVGVAHEHNLSSICTRDELIWMIARFVDHGLLADDPPPATSAGARSGTRAHSRRAGSKRTRSNR